MRLVLLTTDTLHHTYFAREVGKHFPFAHIIYENTSIMPPFDTAHPYEERQRRYEADYFFQGESKHLRDLFPAALMVEHINEGAALELVRKARPDVVIVYGTRKITPPLIALCPEGIINLHGGDPEQYRGLDTHLWALYHNDFSQFIVTLHRLNARLDDGEIISQGTIPIVREMKFHELRAANAALCVGLVLDALRAFDLEGVFKSRPQTTKGRYYSFMPACLKDICIRRFERYTSGPAEL